MPRKGLKTRIRMRLSSIPQVTWTHWMARWPWCPSKGPSRAEEVVGSSKRPCKVLPLQGNNPTHQHILGASWLESSSAQKALVVLVGPAEPTPTELLCLSRELDQFILRSLSTSTTLPFWDHQWREYKRKEI